MESRYDFRTIEKKWRAEWEKNPINKEDAVKPKFLLSGYVPLSFRFRSACRSLERVCAFRRCQPL